MYQFEVTHTHTSRCCEDNYWFGFKLYNGQAVACFSSTKSPKKIVMAVIACYYYHHHRTTTTVTFVSCSSNRGSSNNVNDGSMRDDLKSCILKLRIFQQAAPAQHNRIEGSNIKFNEGKSFSLSLILHITNNNFHLAAVSIRFPFPWKSAREEKLKRKS